MHSLKIDISRTLIWMPTRNGRQTVNYKTVKVMGKSTKNNANWT